MVTGALVLLAGALIPAIMGAKNAPTWLSNATLIIGYGFLAYGFFLAMRARSDAREAATRSPHGTGETESGWEGKEPEWSGLTKTGWSDSEDEEEKS